MTDPRIPESKQKEAELPDDLDQVDPAGEANREEREGDIERP